MTGVWEFPSIFELRDFIEDGIQISKNDLQDDLSDDRAEFVRQLELERLIVPDEWGRGTATIGEEGLTVFAFFSLPVQDEEHLIPGFDQAARAVTQRFVTLINEGATDPPEPSSDWFPSFDIEPVAMSNFESQVSISLGDSEGNTVFDLTNMQAIVQRREVDITNLPRTPLEQLVEEEVEEPEIEEEPAPEPEPIEEQFEPDFPEIEPELRGFAVSENKLEIPTGKETRSVEPRDPYKFELMMGLPRSQLQQRQLLGGEPPTEQLENGVGLQAGLGRLGTRVPVATFPRTSSYIRNRLYYEGIAYILQLYKDMVVYSGFISGYYDMRMKPGEYQSFRNFMNRLELIEERGGPQLIRPISQQEAAGSGLEITPDHPSIEGEKAPWLQNRHYFGIVEENIDHDAWENPTEYLYEQLDTPEQ